MKRLLFLGHRWLGIVLCLFMALWFLSGVVMMYVGYPKLGTAERLQTLPPLASAGCCVNLEQALAALPAGARPRSLRLTSIGGRPVFIAGLEKNRFAAIAGHDGKAVGSIDAEAALAAARAFLPGQPARYLEALQEDAWTHSRALDGHRPLHVVEMDGSDDGQGRTLLYVSASTGEVVRDASATERTWNWLGAWLHWLYPLRGGALDGWWTEIIIYTSLAATLLALSGLVVGLLRWRRRPYANGSRSPYRKAMLRWHHWLGLIFGLLTFTWILSGLLSVNPWKVFDAGTPKPAPARLELAAGTDAPGIGEVLQRFRADGLEARELEWLTFAGTTYVQARDSQGHSRLLPWQRQGVVQAVLAPGVLEAGGRQLLPQAGLAATHLQTEYDWHYYQRTYHSMTGHMEKALPVLRLEFDDPAHTWLYLDPRNGALVQRLDDRLRLKRWLFALFHSWDWLPLLQHRPLWDILLIVASLGGFLVSLSGLVIGLRRLARPRG